ncbi:flavin reductase family protein [Actinoplanes xinjiangensis]|jgi:3-hydroxy-9,10-secoandrosta-1,3,5(10)-triene-9,17-dione monooxygenase reductase component|uniref:Flavin reductase (DIM6/NTAB) family NADH-FMN oxidoreductase RutF n=1 Tax=Actinoplanes xinjiangensis TaxID=512350 RepID=A0A316FB84_9ACTN|nr:flavin reductase family protein [Actinoplanes xinjiangensis]PWK34650.1 flavin reductase (DIM6/NTAB) family NADH-FMN oxidoreductase RutF [Actinoplanes xinjiangensis]GIF43245.1 monooxygenase [Actinoplanes xinjiangensis]
MTTDEPGGRIHSTDPFAVPETGKSQVRRLRGRFAATVTLWTAPGPAGLTVSSAMIADGDPGRVLGLIDEESDFWEAVSAAGRFAVTPLAPDDRQLADRFAGLFPAPGGLFASGEWEQTAYGPVPAGATTWAGCVLDSSRPCGWAVLLDGVIETVRTGSGGPPLVHYRGRYTELV